jgi:cell division septation protein DedD
LWAVQIANGPADRRAEAQRFCDHLTSLGFRSYLAAQGNALNVLVGPYYDRDPAVLRSLSQQFPQQRAAWVEVKP